VKERPVGQLRSIASSGHFIFSPFSDTLTRKAGPDTGVVQGFFRLSVKPDSSPLHGEWVFQKYCLSGEEIMAGGIFRGSEWRHETI